LKKVTLWLAELRSPFSSKVVRLSMEHEKYRWFGMDEAVRDIKREYRAALVQAISYLTSQSAGK
jgi:8-oxo-dGTP pyrophosphatase MutT (NUDIX family)